MPGRALTDAEVAAYDVLPDHLARRVRVHRIPLLPGGYAGMTLGRHILLARTIRPDGTSPLLAHELVHVRQWADEGRIRFLASYLGAFCRGLVRHRRWSEAYRLIPAEVEARKEATDWSRRHTRDGTDRPGGEAAPDTDS